jgi:mannose-6-phosphate isomerase
MFLPSGRVHAIGAGNVILEVQQNSDTTFRVYDWDRVDAKTAKPRDLHIQESLECIKFNDVEPGFAQPHGESVLSCNYFQVNRSSFYEEEERDWEISPDSFQYAFVTQGSFLLGTKEYPRGSSLFIPADAGKLEIKSLGSYAELITVGWPE